MRDSKLVRNILGLSLHTHKLCLAEIVRSVETVDSGVEEHERVECQSPEEESKAGASAVASERESTMYQGQDVTKEATTTSSPDTDSPVMISVDASPNMTYL